MHKTPSFAHVKIFPLFSFSVVSDDHLQFGRENFEPDCRRLSGSGRVPAGHQRRGRKLGFSSGEAATHLVWPGKNLVFPGLSIEPV